MNLEKFTNVEILFHEDLKNKVLIRVPKTPYHVLCTYLKTTGGWNVHVLELTSTKRKQIAHNITNDAASNLVEWILKDGNIPHMKQGSKRDFAFIVHHLSEALESL